MARAANKVFAHADDKQPADGSAVLTYEQATHAARALARGDANAASARPATIGEALEAYEADLTARGRNSYNAALVRYHLPPHLLAQPLSQVTTKQMRHWRDTLIKGGILPATVNRVLKPAHAAFNLAAKLDARAAANAYAWKTGLEALRHTVSARDAVLTDAQVLAVVAAAYDVSAAFGLYVQVHAETGARSSQLARLVVGDLDRNQLMVPSSFKGRGGGKTDRTPDPDHARPRGEAQSHRRRSSGQCSAADEVGRHAVATDRAPAPVQAGRACRQAASGHDDLRLAP
jgi:integrase